MSTSPNFNSSDATAAFPALQETPSQETPPHRKKVSATFLLILCNSLIFYAMPVHCEYIMGKAFGDTVIFSDFDSALLQQWGGNYGPLTLTGQFWRVITFTFLHWNGWHLFVNMLFLFGFGRYLDRLFTRTPILAIYLLTGVTGSIFTLAWSPLSISAGASGAIYGQAGVLIALLCFARSNFSRRDIRNLLLWIIFLMPIELLWGHVSKRTGYAGHLGGILCGFGIGVLLALTFRLSAEERAARRRQVWRLSALMLVFGFTAVTLARRSTALEYLNIKDLLTSSTTTHVTNQNHYVVKRIFIDLKGDPKLVHYFSGLLNAELENAGIEVAGSEHAADGVLRGELPMPSQIDVGWGFPISAIPAR